MQQITGNVSVTLDPHYTVSHELEPDTDTFLVAREASDIILENPLSRNTQWTDYLGISLDPEHTTSMFKGALGDTTFDRVDLRKRVDKDSSRLSLILHDAVNAGRIIRLTQTAADSRYPYRDFEVDDYAKDIIRDFPFPLTPPAAIVWEQDVRDWLQQQVFGKDEQDPQPLDIETLFECLAQRTMLRKEKILGSLVLSSANSTAGTCEFFAHRERVIDESAPHKPFFKNLYWAWIATDMPVSIDSAQPAATIPHADFVITRTLAHFNGNNIIGSGLLNNHLVDPHNRICFDIEATQIHDPVALTHLELNREHKVLDGFKRILQKVQLFDYATR